MVPVVAGSRRQRIAERGMILRVVVGSEVHGISLAGQGDRDEMGVCVEPPETVAGLSRFEHYQFRTQPDGACSGPGDLDLVVYGLRKFATLAARGNPTVLLPLFVPDEHVCYLDELGRELRAGRHLFLSRQAGARFRGYLQSQRRGLMGLRSGGTRNQGRADIRERFGFDVKFAAHMVRLGLQGAELLRTGTITLPVPEPDRTWLLELRRGERTKEEALERAAELEAEIERLTVTSPLPERPDTAALDAWLVDAHRRHWGWV
ncbi:nucleotidyltransferase domain-containing protein [Pseudonocardia sp. S2-4]|uniref:Nucleotidyltransferase domain-containing protein n=2 Tax=Pseudonocardia humida TaxID=2800819 RepID=A0ABT0ZUT4_9PSEU|nr:nucleotidyltransferase domain-containing protein [Pseudonocardia humida]